MQDRTQEMLTERGNRYGLFRDHAAITYGIKHAFKIGRNWELLPRDMKEALDMVAHKIGRILNGDPEYLDSWDDIVGYVTLVTDRLRKVGQYAEEATQLDGSVCGDFDWHVNSAARTATGVRNFEYSGDAVAEPAAGGVFHSDLSNQGLLRPSLLQLLTLSGDTPVNAIHVYGTRVNFSLPENLLVVLQLHPLFRIEAVEFHPSTGLKKWNFELGFVDA